MIHNPDEQQIGEAGLFLYEVPTKILLTLKNSSRDMYIHALAREIDCTNSHLIKTANIMKGMGLLEFRKESRMKFMELTADGREIAGMIERLVIKLKEADYEQK